MEPITYLNDKQSPKDQIGDFDELDTHDRNSLRDKIVKRELKKADLKGKIRAFCCQCIYDPYQEGTWLKQVEKCTSLHCPLYSVQPTPGQELHGKFKIKNSKLQLDT